MWEARRVTGRRAFVVRVHHALPLGIGLLLPTIGPSSLGFNRGARRSAEPENGGDLTPPLGTKWVFGSSIIARGVRPVRFFPHEHQRATRTETSETRRRCPSSKRRPVPHPLVRVTSDNGSSE